MNTCIPSFSFVQVVTFYGAYIEAFYSAHKHYAALPFQAQIQKLIHDANAAVHMFAPYLPGGGADLIISNCAYSQMAWAKEHGLPVTAWTTQTEAAILHAQLAQLQPDVLYFSNPILHQASFLQQLAHKPRLVMGWRAADVPLGTDWTGYDVILSGLTPMLSLATSLGAKEGLWFTPAMPAWVAKALEATPQDIDVVFCGSISPTQHVHRVALLDTLSVAARTHRFSLALHLLCPDTLITENMRPYIHAPVFGMEMYKALRRGRIVVDDRAHHGVNLPDGKKIIDLGGTDTSNMRIFEGTACNSLVLTEHMDGLYKIFTPDVEVGTYTNHQDLCCRILYYLTHHEERQRVAQAGYRRCLGQWNMQKRATALHNEITARLQ